MLADLVQGEFQQLETKEDEGQVNIEQLLQLFHTHVLQERFEHYLTKSFNKTASLMAHSCQANGKSSLKGPPSLTHWPPIVALLAGVDQQLVRDAFLYGRNIGDIYICLVLKYMNTANTSEQEWHSNWWMTCWTSQLLLISWVDSS